MPSLLEALELKYGSSTTDCSLTDEETESSSPKAALSVSIFIPKKSPRHTVPALLVLQDCDIESAGNDAEKLRNKCKNVEELDLAQNKLSQWTEVFDILQHMPKIKFVNLSFNCLAEVLEIKHGSYDLLKNLVLNGTRVTWSTVQGLIHLLHNLEELHLSLNEYKTVDLDYQMSENKNTSVKKLHFTGNPVEVWNEISKLGYIFPNLESLVLAECPIRFESESESSGTTIRSSHDPFRKLRFLNVNGTLLSTWDDVERLARFPALKSLRIQGCPLFEEVEKERSRQDVKPLRQIDLVCATSSQLVLALQKQLQLLYVTYLLALASGILLDVNSPREYTEHERRQLLIARLPNVETLNGGGVISSQEREDAERAFIRYYMDKPEADRPERYSELVAIHGKLDPLVHVDLTPEKRVKVTFTYGDLVEVRSIDVYRTVFELKTKLETMVKIPANRMRLFYVDQVLKAQYGPEEMLYPNKQLYRYNIRNGDEIIIDSKLNRFVSSSSTTSSIRS
ncbi:Tubulin-specific chaperone cofactor E-like protein [Eufriesea mexicana]|uniref:Tubulin-specific chaperone cofactor E-like protein n=1 Tax=Eufriesea mexicana TaxID=516756 RepID=A0A310SFH0_9HYME|nr:Tubulin-specific chaperone cofactor E-like protein [Eufriesea mexicana]